MFKKLFKAIGRDKSSAEEADNFVVENTTGDLNQGIVVSDKNDIDVQETSIIDQSNSFIHEAQALIFELNVCFGNWKQAPADESFVDQSFKYLDALRNGASQSNSSNIEQGAIKLKAYINQSIEENVLADKAFFLGVNKQLSVIKEQLLQTQSTTKNINIAASGSQRAQVVAKKPRNNTTIEVAEVGFQASSKKEPSSKLNSVPPPADANATLSHSDAEDTLLDDVGYSEPDAKLVVSPRQVDHPVHSDAENKIKKMEATATADNSMSVEPAESIAISTQNTSQSLSESSAAMSVEETVQLSINFNRYIENLKKMCVEDAKRANKLVDMNVDISGLLDVGANTAQHIYWILKDALSHLIRFGIESSGRRIELGKSPQANISITVTSNKDNISIQVEDDGFGIDLNAAYHYVLKSGLISQVDVNDSAVNAKSVGEILEQNIMKMIFSCAFYKQQLEQNQQNNKELLALLAEDELCHIENLKQKIISFGGTLDVFNEPNQFTRFEFVLPRFKNELPALIIKQGKDFFAIPKYNLQRVVNVSDVQLHDVNSQHALAKVIFNEQQYLCYTLRTPVFDPQQAVDYQQKKLIIIKTLQEKFALLVDKVLDVSNVVLGEEQSAADQPEWVLTYAQSVQYNKISVLNVAAITPSKDVNSFIKIFTSTTTESDQAPPSNVEHNLANEPDASQPIEAVAKPEVVLPSVASDSNLAPVEISQSEQSDAMLEIGVVSESMVADEEQGSTEEIVAASRDVEKHQTAVVNESLAVSSADDIAAGEHGVSIAKLQDTLQLAAEQRDQLVEVESIEVSPIEVSDLDTQLQDQDSGLSLFSDKVPTADVQREDGVEEVAQHGLHSSHSAQQALDTIDVQVNETSSPQREQNVSAEVVETVQHPDIMVESSIAPVNDSDEISLTATTIEPSQSIDNDLESIELDIAPRSNLAVQESEHSVNTAAVDVDASDLALAQDGNVPAAPAQTPAPDIEDTADSAAAAVDTSGLALAQDDDTSAAPAQTPVPDIEDTADSAAAAVDTSGLALAQDDDAPAVPAQTPVPDIEDTADSAAAAVDTSGLALAQDDDAPAVPAQTPVPDIEDTADSAAAAVDTSGLALAQDDDAPAVPAQTPVPDIEDTADSAAAAVDTSGLALAQGDEAPAATTTQAPIQQTKSTVEHAVPAADISGLSLTTEDERATADISTENEEHVDTLATIEVQQRVDSTGFVDEPTSEYSVDAVEMELDDAKSSIASEHRLDADNSAVIAPPVNVEDAAIQLNSVEYSDSIDLVESSELTGAESKAQTTQVLIDEMSQFEKSELNQSIEFAVEQEPTTLIDDSNIKRDSSVSAETSIAVGHSMIENNQATTTPTQPTANQQFAIDNEAQTSANISQIEFSAEPVRSARDSADQVVLTGVGGQQAGGDDGLELFSESVPIASVELKNTDTVTAEAQPQQSIEADFEINVRSDNSAPSAAQTTTQLDTSPDESVGSAHGAVLVSSDDSGMLSTADALSEGTVAATVEAQALQSKATAYKVLFANAASDEVQTFQQFLQQNGFEDWQIEYSDQAYQHLQQSAADVLILSSKAGANVDLEVLNSIRKDKRLRRQPLVVTTELSSDIFKQRAFLLGANYVLQKPYTQEQMKAVIEVVVQQVTVVDDIHHNTH